MPGNDAAIALQVQSPNSFKGIGDMLNIVRQGQAAQGSALELEKTRRTLEADIAKNLAESRVAVETADPKIEQQRQITARAITEAHKAAQELTQDQRGIVAGVVGTLGRAGVTDPTIYKRELSNLKDVNPDNPGLHKIADAYGRVLENLPKGANIPKVAVGASQFLLKPTEAQASLTPSAGTIGLGGTVNQATVQPSVMGGAPSVQIGAPLANTTLGPGNVETTETGPDKQQYIVTRSPAGVILGTRPLAGGAGGGTGGGAMPRFAPGDMEAIPGLSAEREQARIALQSAPNAHTNNRIVMQELDKAIATGTAGPAIAKVASVLGVKLDTPEEKASAYDLVGKALERNAQEMLRTMGPQTNAALESAVKSQGSVGYNPTAIRKLTRLNDAIVTGAESYQPGLERAISAAGNRGVLAKREYDQKWAQNFDPAIFEIYNAQRAGDKAEVARIVKELGPRAKDIAIRAKALQSLSGTGKLPNE